MLVQIPTPTKGYVNLGDCLVNISAWLLGPFYGAAAAGIGSAMADLISGYTIYAAATFIIKSLMAAASFCVFKALSKRIGSFFGRIISAAAAECVMVFGYFAFESIMYGSVGAALPGMPANIVQGLAGAISSVMLYELVIKRIPGVSSKEDK